MFNNSDGSFNDFSFKFGLNNFMNIFIFEPSIPLNFVHCLDYIMINIVLKILPQGNLGSTRCKVKKGVGTAFPIAVSDKFQMFGELKVLK
jgi:hypothetical protein